MTQKLMRGRSLEKFPAVASKLKAILKRFQQALSGIDQYYETLCTGMKSMFHELGLAA
jgi:hypothetical protein